MVSTAGETVSPSAPGAADAECGFCGKGAAAVAHLVGHGDVLVCNECLDLCDEIIADKLAGSWRRARTFVLRASSGPAKVAATLRNVREELTRRGICGVTILFAPERDGASTLYRRLKETLADLAEVWEPPSRSPERALSIVACRRRTTVAT